jgi:hypothetical protein
LYGLIQKRCTGENTFFAAIQQTATPPCSNSEIDLAVFPSSYRTQLWMAIPVVALSAKIKKLLKLFEGQAGFFF